MTWFLSFQVISFLCVDTQKGLIVLLLFSFLCLASLFPSHLSSFSYSTLIPISELLTM